MHSSRRFKDDQQHVQEQRKYLSLMGSLHLYKNPTTVPTGSSADATLSSVLLQSLVVMGPDLDTQTVGTVVEHLSNEISTIVF